MGEEIIINFGSLTSIAVTDTNHNGQIDEGEVKLAPGGSERLDPKSNPQEFQKILKIMHITAPNLNGVRIRSLQEYTSAIRSLNPERHLEAIPAAQAAHLQVNTQEIRFQQISLLLRKAYLEVDRLKGMDKLTLAEKQTLLRPKLDEIRKASVGVTMKSEARSDLNRILVALSKLDDSFSSDHFFS